MDRKILIGIIANILVISLVLGLIIVPNIHTNGDSDSQLSHQLSDASSAKTPKWDYENRTLTTHEFDYSKIVSFNISDELTDNTNVDDIVLGHGISYKYDCGLVNSMGGLTTEGSGNTIENMDNTAYYEKISSDKTQQGYKTYVYKDEGTKYDVYQVYIDINNLKVIESNGFESNYAYFHGSFPSLKEANVFIDTFKVQFNDSDARSNNVISKVPPERTDIKTHEVRYGDFAVFNLSNELTKDTKIDTDIFAEGKLYEYKSGISNMLGGLIYLENDDTIQSHDNDAYYEKIETKDTQQGYKTHLYKYDNFPPEYELYIDLNRIHITESGEDFEYRYFIGTFETRKEAEIFIDTFKIIT
ncbi:MAG: hypothetical protein IKF11_01175 [Methanobrevibacter sp.]|nr:hypothetical protein [Methanobrevibacter sp.]